MKKILIFTASTGGGHNEVAVSLEREFGLKGYEVIKLDILKEINKVLDVVVADGYRVMANKLPKMYGGIYKISNRRKMNKGITKLFTRIASRKIYELIKSYEPSLIIGTHPFIVNVVGILKERGIIYIPFISVVTDYQAHRTYVNNNVDAYITGSYYTGESLVNRGARRDSIYPYGIPIRREFLEDKEDELIDDEKFTVLLMGGSMGLTPMKRVFKHLVNNTNRFRIIVVCGNNKELKKSIEEKYVDRYAGKEIIVYGFTRNIPQLMEASDVVITKPGGLTVSEAIAKKIPMIIPYLIPGQEEENAEFLVKHDVAFRIYDIKEINKTIDNLIYNPEILEKMRRNMTELSKVYSQESIVDLAGRLIGQYENRRESFRRL